MIQAPEASSLVFHLLIRIVNLHFQSKSVTTNKKNVVFNNPIKNLVMIFDQKLSKQRSNSLIKEHDVTTVKSFQTVKICPLDLIICYVYCIFWGANQLLKNSSKFNYGKLTVHPPFKLKIKL